MTEQEKAFTAFEKLMKDQIKKAQATLEVKVVKKMNAVGNDGTVYATEREIQDAYGYDLITDAERIRLLEALEYRNERPLLKEDYFIALCHKAIGVLNEAKSKVAEAERDRQRRDKAAQIYKAGNQPRYCYCCGEIIGEVLGGDVIGTKWYNNHAECANGHVCKSCLSRCVGKARCDDRRNQQ